MAETKLKPQAMDTSNFLAYQDSTTESDGTSIGGTERDIAGCTRTFTAPFDGFMFVTEQLNVRTNGTNSDNYTYVVIYVNGASTGRYSQVPRRGTHTMFANVIRPITEGVSYTVKMRALSQSDCVINASRAWQYIMLFKGQLTES